jgi:hypothetical protein
MLAKKNLLIKKLKLDFKETPLQQNSLVPAVY